MVKLSQQLGQLRSTRTQRKIEEQEYQKQSRIEFENLKAQASEYQKNFEGITSVEEYESKYNQLPSNIKPLFKSPSEVKQLQEQDIQTTRERIKEKVNYYQQKYNEIQSRLNQGDAPRSLEQRQREVAFYLDYWQVAQQENYASKYDYSSISDFVEYNASRKISISKARNTPVERELSIPIGVTSITRTRTGEYTVKSKQPIQTEQKPLTEINIQAVYTEPVKSEKPKQVITIPESIKGLVKIYEPKTKRVGKKIETGIDLGKVPEIYENISSGIFGTVYGSTEPTNISEAKAIKGYELAKTPDIPVLNILTATKIAYGINLAFSKDTGKAIGYNKAIEQVSDRLTKASEKLESSGYTIETKKLAEDIEDLNQDIASFNLEPVSLSEQKRLIKRQSEIESRKKIIESQYDVYKQELELAKAEAKAGGVNLQVDENTGDVKFLTETGEKIDTRSLYQKISESTLSPEGKLTWKTAEFGGFLAVSQALKTGSEFAILGGTGVLSGFGESLKDIKFISKIKPQTLEKTILISGSVLSLGVGAVQGYKSGKVIAGGKYPFYYSLERAVISESGFLGGFYGAKVGIKSYEESQLKKLNKDIEKQILKQEDVRVKSPRGLRIKQYGKSESIKIKNLEKISGKYNIKSHIIKERLPQEPPQKIVKYKGDIEVTSGKEVLKGNIFIKENLSTGKAIIKLYTPQYNGKELKYLERTLYVSRTKPFESVKITEGSIEKEIRKIIYTSKLASVNELKYPVTSYSRALGGRRGFFTKQQFEEAQFLSKVGTEQLTVKSLAKLDEGGFYTISKGVGYTGDWVKQQSIISKLINKLTKIKPIPIGKTGRVSLTQQSFIQETTPQTFDVNKIINKIPRIPRQTQIQTQIFDRTSLVGVKNVETLLAKDLLKQQLMIFKSGLVGFTPFMIEKQIIKQTPIMKLNQVEKLTLKQQLSQINKISQVEKLTQIEDVAQAQKVSQVTETSLITELTPVTGITQIPPFEPTNFGFIGFPPFFFGGGVTKGKGRRRKKLEYEYLYTPDFTSRILGLKPMKIKQVNMNKLVKKLQTGFEIRKGVIPE